jgi:hypothetical protein
MNVKGDSTIIMQYLQSIYVDVVALMSAVLATAPWVDRDDRSMLYRGQGTYNEFDRTVVTS